MSRLSFFVPNNEGEGNGGAVEENEERNSTHDSALLFNYLARPRTACGTVHTQNRGNEHQPAVIKTRSGTMDQRIYSTNDI